MCTPPPEYCGLRREEELAETASFCSFEPPFQPVSNQYLLQFTFIAILNHGAGELLKRIVRVRHAETEVSSYGRRIGQWRLTVTTATPGAETSY